MLIWVLILTRSPVTSRTNELALQNLRRSLSPQRQSSRTRHRPTTCHIPCNHTHRFLNNSLPTNTCYRHCQSTQITALPTFNTQVSLLYGLLHIHTLIIPHSPNIHLLFAPPKLIHTLLLNPLLTLYPITLLTLINNDLPVHFRLFHS